MYIIGLSINLEEDRSCDAQSVYINISYIKIIKIDAVIPVNEEGY